MTFEIIISGYPIALAVVIVTLCLTFLMYLRMKLPRRSRSDTPPMLKEPAEGSRRNRETIRLERED